jgi:hypothetical protein
MLKRLFTTLLLLVITSLASAQLFDSIGTTLKDANLGSTLEGGVAPVDPAAPTADLSFTPNGQRLINAEFDKLVGTVPDATPEQVEQFKQVIDQLLTGLDAEVEKLGENPHDLGTATAAFFELAYWSYHNLNPAKEIPDNQSLAAVKQFRTLLSSNPTVVAMTNDQRQLFYEAAIGIPGLFIALQQYAMQQGDTASADQWRSQVINLFKETSGIDVSQVQYTDQGVVVASAGQTPQGQTPQDQPETTQPTPEAQTTTETPTTQPTDNQTSNPLGGANPLGSETADPFVGSFSGDNLTLTLQGANGTYTGEMNFNGQPFPVQATAEGTNLTGTFTSGGNTFNFTATLQDNALTLTSDGSTFNLIKQ